MLIYREVVDVNQQLLDITGNSLGMCELCSEFKLVETANIELLLARQQLYCYKVLFPLFQNLALPTEYSAKYIFRGCSL